MSGYNDAWDIIDTFDVKVAQYYQAVRRDWMYLTKNENIYWADFDRAVEEYKAYKQGFGHRQTGNPRTSIIVTRPHLNQHDWV